MKLQLFLASLALLAAPAGAFAESRAPMGPVTAVRNASPRQFEVQTAKGTICITPLNENIFKVTTFPKGSDLKTPVSQSAIMKPTISADQVRFSATPAGVTVATATTSVKVDRATGRISFYDKAGNLLLSEAAGVDNSNPKDRRISFLPAQPGENLYGAGERGHKLRLNGDTLVNYNRQNYGYTGSDKRISQMGITMPYFASSRGYSVLFDDYTKSKLILGDPIEYIAPIAIGPISYYFINGEGTLAGTVSGYADLTGHQELPPLWTLGYITSKYGYHDAREALGVVDSLKTRGYPVDGMVLDLYWYGVETDMGRLDWDRKKWPDPEGFLKQMRDQGVKVVAITQPYVNKKGAIDNYNYLVENHMTTTDAEGANHDVTTWVGDAGMIDVSNPRTRDWYWSKYKARTLEGMEGWWGDLGEPEVHPVTIRHSNGQTAEQYHNVYGNEWSRIIYDGFKKEFPDRRLMLLMRGGTAGLQRYNVFPWTTDVSRTWGGLEPQVKFMVGAGLSGLGYLSSDIGGFAVDQNHPRDPELYARWLQFGAFTPMLRTHAQLEPEPYHFPEVEKISKKFIRQRYEWLPYNYTLAWENASKGWPLARPLDFHGENPGEAYATLDDEYMWGDEVLIAPVMKKGQRSRKVLLPAGGTWINYNHPELSYKGGSNITVKAPLDELPMFVREGSFIPLYTLPINNVGEYNLTHLTVQYFPARAETTYTLYDDDRKSPTALQDDNYILTTFKGQSASGQTSISMSTDKSPSAFDWMPSTRTITFEVMCQKRAPRSVTLTSGGETTTLDLDRAKDPMTPGYYYDARKKCLVITVMYTGAPLTVTAK